MRLFIAIKFSKDIQDYILGVQNILIRNSNRGNYTPEEKLHLTLVYIGEINKENLSDVESVINKLNIQSFKLKLNKIGAFKSKGKGELFYLGVEKNRMLDNIYKTLFYELRLKGFDIEKRAFKPHITLGRNVELFTKCNKEEIMEKSFDKTVWVDRILLIKSERMENKTVYTEIFTKLLK